MATQQVNDLTGRLKYGKPESKPKKRSQTKFVPAKKKKADKAKRSY